MLWELYDKDFKSAIIEMFQQAITNTLETPPCGNPAQGLCVLSNYLFIEKKGGEKKKKSHVRVIRMRREAAEGGKN